MNIKKNKFFIKSDYNYYKKFKGKIICELCGEWDWLLYQESFKKMHSKCKNFKIKYNKTSKKNEKNNIL